MGSTTLANADTVVGHVDAAAAPDTGSGFTNGVDKFALADGLTFDDLTIVRDNSLTDTHIKYGDQYLMVITDMSHGYIGTLGDDFVSIDVV